MQTTDCVALVEPTYLGKLYLGPQADQILLKEVMTDFYDLIEGLKEYEINFRIYESPPKASAATFPNNWITFHWEMATPTVVLYPMRGEVRRLERQSDLLIELMTEYRYSPQNLKIVDLTYFEKMGHYLEGTGSLVLDRQNHIAYANMSDWTHKEVLDVWKQQLGYEVCSFSATWKNNRPVYHTNVLMTLGEKFCVICLDCINSNDRDRVYQMLTQKSHREVIPITKEQMENYCANILQIKNRHQQPVICLSSTAYQSFRPHQLNALKKYCQGRFCFADYRLIEKLSLGSIRCSLLEALPTSTQFSLCRLSASNVSK